MMKFEFKDKSNSKRSVIITASLAVLFGTLNSLFGEIFLAPAAAFLSVLFLFESTSKRIFSYVVPTVIVILNVFLDGIFSVLGVAPLALAIIIYLMYKKGRSKAECVVALTVATVLLILLSLYFAAVNMTGSFDFEAVKNFYLSIYEDFKADFIRQMSELSNVNPALEGSIFTEDELVLLFDSIAAQLISVLVNVAFVITGIALKIFTHNVYRFESEPHIVVGWRFRITNVFAYFYAALFFFNLFIGAGFGVTELIVINLYNIFMVVFAYFGFTVARSFLSRGRSRGFATAMLIGGIILLSALALQLLSVIGLIFTIIDNKRNSVKNDN